MTDWRRRLSNFDEAPFSLDGLRWRSVEHCFQATKFLAIDRDYYRSFSIDSDSELSRAIGPAVKSAGGRRAHPLDAAALADWDRTKLALVRRALAAKFEANGVHRAVLEATRMAKLTHRPARTRYAHVEVELMQVRGWLRGAAIEGLG
jgi:predicted NAD-dependent protein-ADP-ribosyltransferase YbiA (DUF1768 family)